MPTAVPVARTMSSTMAYTRIQMICRMVLMDTTVQFASCSPCRCALSGVDHRLSILALGAAQL